MIQVSMIQTTTASEALAETIAEALLTAGLAACVQLTPIRSRYVWKGEIARDEEWLLLIKTRATLFEAVRARIRELHDYETPEVLAVSVAEADADYLAWLAASTRG